MRDEGSQDFDPRERRGGQCFRPDLAMVRMSSRTKVNYSQEPAPGAMRVDKLIKVFDVMYECLMWEVVAVCRYPVIYGGVELEALSFGWRVT